MILAIAICFQGRDALGCLAPPEELGQAESDGFCIISIVDLSQTRLTGIGQVRLILAADETTSMPEALRDGTFDFHDRNLRNLSLSLTAIIASLSGANFACLHTERLADLDVLKLRVAPFHNVTPLRAFIVLKPALRQRQLSTADARNGGTL